MKSENQSIREDDYPPELLKTWERGRETSSLHRGAAGQVLRFIREAAHSVPEEIFNNPTPFSEREVCVLMPKYFEGCRAGDKVVSLETTVTEADLSILLGIARLNKPTKPIEIDEEYVGPQSLRKASIRMAILFIAIWLKTNWDEAKYRRLYLSLWY